MAAQLDQDELFERFAHLGSKNHEAIVLLTARNALRVFPFLADKGSFNFWPKVDQPRYLLALWRALVISFLNDQGIYESIGTSQEIIQEAENASVSNFAFQHSSDADSYGAAIRAGVSASNIKDTDFSTTNNFSTSAHVNARHAISAAWNDLQLRQSVYNDLLLLESDDIEIVRTLALWNGVELASGVDDLVENRLQKALTSLSQYPKARFLIRSIHDLYMGIYRGQADIMALKSSLDQVHVYLESKQYLQDEMVSNVPSDSYNHECVAEKDSLKRKPLVDVFKKMLVASDNNKYRAIGLFGDWGVGKSSFLRHLEIALSHDRQPFLFAKFNAWEYEHTDNLQAGIVREMIDALSQPRENYKEKNQSKQNFIKSLLLFWNDIVWLPKRLFLAFRFSTRIHGWNLFYPIFIFFVLCIPWIFDGVIEWLLSFFPNDASGRNLSMFVGFGGLGGLVFLLIKELKKLLANPLAKEFLTYLKLPDYVKHLGLIPVMRKNVEILADVRLQGIGFNIEKPARLLYIVDELDRCEPKNIVKVLEAVKLVLDIPNVTVVVAVDYRMVLSALALHYEALEGYHHRHSAKVIARDYLAKIFHVSVTLGCPDKGSVNMFLSDVWKDLGVGHLDRQEQSLFEPIEQGVLSEVLADESVGVDVDKNKNEEIAGNSEENSHEIEEVGLKPRFIYSLSEKQKRSFSALLDYFGLVNPRQIKRLDDTYKILQHYYRVDVEIDDADTIKRVDSSFHFPILLTLFSLEYINQVVVEDKEKRLKLLEFLMTGKAREGIDNKINYNIAEITSKKIQGIPLSLVEAIEPFVLPAIDDASISGKN